MRNSLPFISPWPFATTEENDSRNSFTILLESIPAGAVIPVTAAPGIDPKTLSRSALRQAWGNHQRLLRSPDDYVNSPSINVKMSRAQTSDGVNDQKRIAVFADQLR